MTEQERTAKANKLFWDLETFLVNLYGRWLDEMEFEPLSEYGKVIEPKITEVGGTDFKMSNRSFSFTFALAGATYQFSLKRNRYFYARIA